jgi:hypothetical protein
LVSSLISLWPVSNSTESAETVSKTSRWWRRIAEDSLRASSGVMRPSVEIFEHELIVVGLVARAGRFDGVLHEGDRGEEGVDGDGTDGLFGLLVLLGGSPAASDGDFEVGVEATLAVERADHLVRVDEGDGGALGLELDVRSLHGAGLVDVDGALEGFALVGFGADAHLLEVEDDLGDVFDDAFDRLELVLHAFDRHRGDRGAFDGAQQDAAERVADGVTEAGLEGFGEILRVGGGRGRLLFLEGLGALELSEALGHVCGSVGCWVVAWISGCRIRR